MILSKYPTDDEAKKMIVDIGRRMYEKNFVAANDGNISVRCPDGHILITPTGVYKGELTPEILEMAGGAGSWRGTGGMATKLTAARIAMESGCDMVITNGARMEDLYGIVAGKDIGTRFLATK